MIFGADGKPLNPKRPEPLPLLIESTIEAKVNTALDYLREDNRQFQRDASIRGWIKFIIWSLVAAGLFVIIDIYGPDKVEEWTKKFVNERMNEPMLERVADEIMHNRIALYIDGRLVEVSNRLSTLGHSLEVYESDMRGISDQLHEIIASVDAKYHDAEKNLTEKFSSAEKSLQHLSDQITSATNIINSLKIEQQFISTVYRAENYEYDAVIELIRIVNEQKKFSNEAKNILSKVHNKLELERFNEIKYIPNEFLDNYEYNGPFATDEIYEIIKINQGNPRTLQSIVNYISYRGNKIFIKELVRMAINEKKDILTLSKLVDAISKFTNNKFSLWNMRNLNEWWSIHEQDYTDWPHEHYNADLEYFNKHDYVNALESFRQVLKVDDDADKSRALAIACAVETGNIDLAMNMTKSFNEKNARWAQWADTKIILAVEGPNRATEMLAELSRKYRTFPREIFTQPKAHVWRQIDWNLYDKLTKDDTK